MAIEIKDTGFEKIYKFFCEKCNNFIEVKEADVIEKKNEYEITERYLKCDFCGHKKKI